MKKPEIKPTVRIGIYGASGSGKTFRAKKLIEKCTRLVVFDSLGDFAGYGWLRVYDIKGLKAALVKNWQKGFKIAYIPKSGNEESELDEVSMILYAAQAEYPRDPQITFVVDELSLCYPKNGKCSTGFTNLACRGRHRGINLIGISQRIAQVNTNFRGNCTSSYFFRPADHVDIDTLAKIIGRDYIEKIRTMENYNFFHFKNGKIIFKN